jgi:heptosyltransferase-2
MLDSHKVDKDRVLIAMAPGAAESKRRWPASRYLELAFKLQTQLNAFVLILGDERDRKIVDEMAKTIGADVINLSGQTTLRQTAALLRRTTMFIGNCSGPLHLAAAADIPVVEISCHPRGGSKLHPNSPTRFGPWLVPQMVLQPEQATYPRFQACEANIPHCILSVSVDQVAKAAFSLLEGTRGINDYPSRAG